MDLTAYSFVVVGSGFFGSVMAERISTELGKKVLVIEKRPHIGGNCYSETDQETGIEYHTYGTHIFHTSNAVVWEYINRFTTFNGYRHQVLAQVGDRMYQLPINLETINSFFNVNLKPYEVDDFMKTVRGNTPPGDPHNFESKAISLVGQQLYEAFFKGYSIKQWQTDPGLLPSSIFSRLPFRKNYDENYYYDQWQGIPSEGYTAIFEKMLSSEQVKLLLNTDFFSIKDQLKPGAIIIYSGAIDRYFDYKFGKLTWRTLRFEKQVMPYGDYQGTAVVNFPDAAVPYTRVHEPRHLHPERNYQDSKTLVIHEYSEPDNGENPYYPLMTPSNFEKLNLYKAALNEQQNVIISGRLGEYKYFDMDQTIAHALHLFETKLKILSGSNG